MAMRRPFGVIVLGLHVFGFVGDQGSEGLQIGEDPIRVIGVNVDLEELLGPDDDQRVTLFSEAFPNRPLFRKSSPRTRASVQNR